MTAEHKSQAPDDLVREVLGVADADTVAGISALEQALASYADDARLHFMYGSLLVSEKRFIAAHEALTRAVALDPDFHLARFQLGFFELTSGEAATAQRTWQPLKSLPGGHYLVCFVDGLEHLIADRFADCIAALSQGIAANQENLPLNGDMQLIIERSKAALGEGDSSGQPADDVVSATSLLLGATRRTRQ
ncbi:MAG: hypothetical protein J0M19_11625 [Sphingomonadales bacterium]|nr:hypothetical protein [Sphingomonadales bacterium]